MPSESTDAPSALPPAARYYSARWHRFYHVDRRCSALQGIREASLREVLGADKQVVESTQVPEGLEPCGRCIVRAPSACEPCMPQVEPPPPLHADAGRRERLRREQRRQQQRRQQNASEEHDSECHDSAEPTVLLPGTAAPNEWPSASAAPVSAAPSIVERLRRERLRREKLAAAPSATAAFATDGGVGAPMAYQSMYEA